MKPPKTYLSDYEKTLLEASPEQKEMLLNGSWPTIEDEEAFVRGRCGKGLGLSPAETIAKAQAKAKRNKWQDAYALQIKQAGIIRPIEEYQAIPNRKFRWDFAWPECLILVEIQGGIWSSGKSGHSTGTGINRDCEKGNLANLASFCCLSFTSDQIRNGMALEQTKEALRLFQPF